MSFINFFGNPSSYQTIINLSIPLILAALAAVVSNKVGILNIGIEGTMIISAMSAALFSRITNNAFIGVFGSIVVGALMGYITYVATVKMKVNNILVGIALNMIAAAASILILYVYSGNFAALNGVALKKFDIPLLSKIPFIGKAFFTNLNFLVFLTIILIFSINFLFKKTKLGLRIRAVGLNDVATQTVGINTNSVKMIALIITGVLAGLAGSYMSQANMSSFNPGMVAGRGFIGVAAEAIGGGKPIMSSLFGLLFGLIDAIAITESLPIKPELLKGLPYLMTLIGLIAYSVIRKNKLNNLKIEKEILSDEKIMGN